MMNAFVLLMHVLIILQHVTKVVTGVMFLFHDLNNPMQGVLLQRHGLRICIDT